MPDNDFSGFFGDTGNMFPAVETGSSFLGNLFNDTGFTGNPYQEGQMGWNDNPDNPVYTQGNRTLSPEALSWLNKYQYTPNMQDGNPATSVWNNGKNVGTYRTGDKDSAFDKFAYWAIPTVVGAGFGGGVAGAVGGGTTGSIASGATQGAISSGAQGGDALKGAITGGIGGGLGAVTSAYNPAGMAGIENPTYASMVNKGVGSAAGTALRGGNGQDILKSGLTSAGVAGLNSAGGNVGGWYKDMFSQFAPTSTGGMEGLYDQPGNMVTDGMGDTASPEMYSDEGGRFGTFAGANNNQQYTPQEYMQQSQTMPQGAPQKSALSFEGPSSFSGLGSTVGNFLGNNAGDLASMLYGFYNNRKQQNALNQQMSGLQGLYGQNSPYAQQLRSKLQAQAAQRGTRLNTGGREVQLQAALADRAASMAPAMYQMQQGQNNLQNNNMNMLLQGMNKMGGFKALGDMFRPSASLTGPGSMDAYGRMDDMYGNVG